MKQELDYTYEYRVEDAHRCISAACLSLADWMKATSAVRSQRANREGADSIISICRTSCVGGGQITLPGYD